MASLMMILAGGLGRVLLGVRSLLALGGLGALPLVPGVGLGGELALGERVAPVAERAFRELHDVALVHDRDALALVDDGVLDRGAEEALGAFLRDGLDADARRVREADLAVELREGFLEQLLELLVLGAALLEFDAGVDVLGVFTEDHHVDLLRRLDRGGHALEPAHRTQADVEVEHLAQRDVQRADATADRRRERALDRDQVFAAGLDGFVGQPGVEEVVGLLAGIDLHPVDLALAAVGLGDRGVEHAHGGAPDVGAGAVAFDERDDGLVGNGELAVGDRDLLALRGHDELDRGGHHLAPVDLCFVEKRG